MKILLALALLVTHAHAKTLVKIAILPPVDGYHITSNTGTAQLGTLCTYDDASTDNCSLITLTWGSSTPAVLSVNSSGLTTGGTVFTLTSAGNASSGRTTYTGTVTGGDNDNYRGTSAVIAGFTNGANNGTFQITDSSSTSITVANGSGVSETHAASFTIANTSADIYAYDAITNVLGHHPVWADSYAPTSLTFRPGSGSAIIVANTTVIVGAVDNTNRSVSDFCAWTNSDPTKMTVNYIGEITGVAAGTAVATCTYYTKTATRTMTATNPTPAVNVWWVRPLDGGTVWTSRVNGQCDGTVDAPYPGTGTHRQCAVNNIMYCFTDESTNTIYTGIAQGGDICRIHQQDGSYMNTGNKTPTTAWITYTGLGAGGEFPNGTPANPTIIQGSNYASCSTARDSPGNAALLNNYYAFAAMDNRGLQNFKLDCIDWKNYADCTANLNGNFDFPCPSGNKSFAFYTDDLTANITLHNSRIHGFWADWTGIPGPGVLFDHSYVEGGSLDCINFDDPFGEEGNRADGLTMSYSDISYCGGTEELAKTVSSVSRDGSGNLTVTFPTNAMVNYIAGTNITLQGMTPSDLNGTFPVTSVSFTQQSVSITGGTCSNVPGGISPISCVFTTGTAPAFIQGSFVLIAGASPSFLNGTYEVWGVSGSGFTIVASPSTRIGWTTGSISSGGTAKTAVSLVATQTGSAETASVLGTAAHVHPFHRFMDQGDGGASNGDAFGAGNGTRGTMSFDHGSMRKITQDGWDQLHSFLDNIIFTNSIVDGAEGQPVKLGNMDAATVYNNQLIVNCASFLAFDANMPADFNQYVALPCRASDGFVVHSRAWTKAVVTNNTWDNTQPTLWDDFCADAIGCQTLPVRNFIAQNNIFLCFLDTNSPTYSGSPSGIYFSEAPPTTPDWSWNNNMSFNCRNPPSGGSGNQWTTDPLVVTKIPDISTFSGETNALVFNMSLTGSSPAIGTGIHNAYTPTLDYGGSTRPNPPAIGAWEFGGAPPSTYSSHSLGVGHSIGTSRTK